MENENKIKQSLRAIELAYKEMLKINLSSRNQKYFDIQVDLFNKYTRNEDYSSFYKKSAKNLEKINARFLPSSSDKIVEILYDKKYGEDIIDAIRSDIEISSDLKNALIKLSSRYSRNLNKLNNLNNVNSAPVETNNISENEIKSNNVIKQNDNENVFDKLEPHKPNFLDRLSGKDVNKNKIGLLYGMAADIFYLMSIDQYTNLSRTVDNKNTLYNKYFDSKSDVTIENYFNKYNVSNLNELLNKYDRILIQYNNLFSKLNSSLQDNYKIKNVNQIDMQCGIVDKYSIYNEFVQENFKFPPSKGQLINIMNRRIISSRDFSILSDNIYYSDANIKVKENYNNLTKNMTVNEVSNFYHAVMSDMRQREENGIATYDKEQYINMQKMFCDIVISKENINVENYKSVDELYENIIENTFKDEVKFGIKIDSEIDPNALKDSNKNETIYAKYVNFKAHNPGTNVSFKEFVQQIKTKINNNNIQFEEEIIEEVKGKSL